MPRGKRGRPPEDPVDVGPVPGEVPDTDTTSAPANGVPIAEAIAQAAEAVPDQVEAPVDRTLPFPAPKFDEHKALAAIIESQSAVAKSRYRYDGLKDKAAAAKKALESDELALSELIADIRKRKEEYEDWQARPKLAPVEGASDLGCAWERTHGTPCVICRNPERQRLQADDEAHVTEVQNALDVDAAMETRDAEPVFSDAEAGA